MSNTYTSKYTPCEEVGRFFDSPTKAKPGEKWDYLNTYRDDTGKLHCTPVYTIDVTDVKPYKNKKFGTLTQVILTGTDIKGNDVNVNSKDYTYWRHNDLFNPSEFQVYGGRRKKTHKNKRRHNKKRKTFRRK